MTRHFLILFLCTASLLSAGTLSIGALSGKPGGSISADVTWKAEGGQIAGLQFDLDYDASVLVVSGTIGSAASDAEKSLSISDPSTGKKRILIVGFNQNTIADGVAAVLSVGIKDGAAVGSYPLKFSNASATDKSGKTVSLTTTDGTIAVSNSSVQIGPGGIQHGTTFQPGLAARSWFAVKGINLSATTRAWQGSDFNGNNLPQSLDGVRVSVNGKPAYIYYVSPEQINALAPDEDIDASVTVTVTNAQGQSASQQANLKRFMPGLWMVGSTSYAIGVFSDGNLAGPTSLWPGHTRPAKPGDALVFYATGLGPTSPVSSPGLVVTGANPPANPVKLKIGGIDTNAWVGLVASGQYQINATVPNLSNGDAAVSVEVNGLASPVGAIIPIQQ